jgi:hypothetical protein
VPGPRLVHMPSEPSGSQRSPAVHRSPSSQVPSWGNEPGGRTLIRTRSSLGDGAPSPDLCGLWVGGRDPSTFEVAAPSPTVGLGPELSLKLRQAPDPGAVGAEVGLDLGRGLAEADQVDAEQLRAPFQRRCDRPSQARVVPSPHRPRLSNTSSRPNPESCVPRQEPYLGRRGRAGSGARFCRPSPGTQPPTSQRPRPKPGARTASKGWSEGFLCMSSLEAVVGVALQPTRTQPDPAGVDLCRVVRWVRSRTR